MAELTAAGQSRFAAQNVFSIYTRESHIAQEILAAAKARVTYHFILRDFTSTNVVYIKLLNWESRIKTKALPASKEKLASVLQVLYWHDSSPEEAADQSPKAAGRLPKGWRPTAKIEEFIYADQMLMFCIGVLNEHNLRLPPSMREVTGMNLSFLRRLSEVL